MTKEKLVQGREALSLITFCTNGNVEWSSSVSSPVNGSTLAKLVKIFLASISISDALLSKDENAKYNHSNHDNDDDYDLPKATVLHGSEDTLLICSPLNIENTKWMGLLVKPLVVENIRTLDAILPSFQRAANFLIPHYPDEKTRTQKLWFHIRESYGAAFWSDYTRFNNGRSALLLLTNGHLAKLMGSTPRLVSPVSELGSSITESLTNFSQIIHNMCGREVQKRICIFSTSNGNFYGQSVNSTESEFCEWYYKEVINIGSRRFSKNLIEANGDGIVRIIAHYYEWVFYVDFVISIDFEIQQTKELRQKAYDIVRKISESKT